VDDEMMRGIVTAVIVAIVGVYVLDKLAARGRPSPVPDGEKYVNVRGVIAAATAIAKASPIMGKLSRNAAGRPLEQEG
jgi:hypothetical protein